MDNHPELLEPLLDGLPDHERDSLLRSIARARSEQLEQKLHPRRRRRRGPDGVLRPPPAPPAEVE